MVSPPGNASCRSLTLATWLFCIHKHCSRQSTLPCPQLAGCLHKSQAATSTEAHARATTPEPHSPGAWHPTKPAAEMHGQRGNSVTLTDTFVHIVLLHANWVDCFVWTVHVPVSRATPHAHCSGVLPKVDIIGSNTGCVTETTKQFFSIQS